MKHFNNKLKIFAISALTIGYLGNYECAEGANIQQILDSNTLSQQIKCKLQVKVKIAFQGTREAFSLYDENNNPVQKEIPFTVEGLNNPKIKMELQGDCFKYSDEGDVIINKLHNNEQEVADENAPSFEILVIKENGVSSQFEKDDDSEDYIVELDEAPESHNYKISIKPKEITHNTTLGEYETGTLKFSIIGE